MFANARRIRRSLIERPEEWGDDGSVTDKGFPYSITHLPTGYGIWVANGLGFLQRYNFAGQRYAKYSFIEQLIIWRPAMATRRRLRRKRAEQPRYKNAAFRG